MEARSWASMLNGFTGLGSILDDDAVLSGRSPAYISEELDESLLEQYPALYGHSEEEPGRTVSKGAISGQRGTGVKALEAALAEKLKMYDHEQQLNTVLRARNELLEKVVKSREQQIQRLKELKWIEEQGGPDPLAPFGCTVQQLRALKGPGMLKYCKYAMSTIGSLLAQAELGVAAGDEEGEGEGEGGGGGEEGAQGGGLPGAARGKKDRDLQHWELKLTQLAKYTWLIHEEHILVSSRDVNGSRDGGYRFDHDVADDIAQAWPHWGVMVGMLGLSHEQGRDAWLLHDLYVAWHNSVLRERRALSDQMAQEMRGNMGTSMAYTNLLDGLQCNLVKERCLMLLVVDVFLSHIITGSQLLKVMVCSYPRLPDMVAVLAAAAAPNAPSRLSRAHSEPTPVFRQRSYDGAYAGQVCGMQDS